MRRTAPIYSSGVHHTSSRWIEPTVLDPLRQSVRASPIKPFQPATIMVNTIEKHGLDRDLQEIQDRYQAEAQEVQKSYLTAMDKQVKLGKTIQELEFVNDEQGRTIFGLEDRLRSTVRDLEHERRLRIDLEHECKGLKDELNRKDHLLNNVELVNTKLDHDLSSLTGENSGLRAEINRLSDLYNSRLRDIEDRYIGQIRDLNDQAETLRTKIEAITIDNANHIRAINTEWQGKLGKAEEMIRERDRTVSNLDGEVRRLNDHISQLKVSFEDELRRTVGITREEEKNKWMLVQKDFEAQMRGLSHDAESLNRKNQDLIRDIQARDRHIQDLKIGFDGELHRLRNEIVELRRQLENANLVIEKNRNEMNSKDNQINRLDAELGNMRREFDRIKELNRQEINRLNTEHANEVRRWEDVERALKNKCMDLEGFLRASDDENMSLRGEYERLKETIAGGLNRTIHQAFVEAQPLRNPFI